jgi:hypothetical protein
MLNEVSPELVGKVNKARLAKPAKSDAARQTLNRAVKKAWLKTKVGVIKKDVKEDLGGAVGSPTTGGGPANVAGPAVSTDPVHWSKRQPRIGESGRPKKYGQPMLFKATLRRKAVSEQLHNPPMKKVYYKKIGKYVPAVSRTSSAGGGGDGSESVQREHIVKVGSQYRLVSKASGKNLGTYPSRAGAEKREREVQYFKHKG